jgi:signal transduction histidine kinase
MQGEIGQSGSRQDAPLVAIRYAGALLLVAAGVAVARALPPIFDPTVLLLMAVVLAAWFSGLWPALLASVVATPGVRLLLHASALHAHARSRSFTAPRRLHRVRDAVCRRRAPARRAPSSRCGRHATSSRCACRERTADLTRANEELEDLAGRLISAQEQERSRIGRELHDHISQTLGVLTIKIDQLRAETGVPQGIAESLDELRQDTVDVADDVHRLSHRLHSSTLDYLGLVPALQKLVNEFSGRYGIDIEFTHTSVPSPLPSDVSLCLFRVTEESLTNIAKHSQAASGQVQLRGAADGLHLTIVDTGVGFDPGDLDTRAGLGFVSMRERLRVVHGTVRVDAAPSRGTRIEVTIPADRLEGVDQQDDSNDDSTMNRPSHPNASRADEPGPDRVLHELGVRLHPESIHQPIFVKFHGARADVEHRRHFLHRFALGQQPQHLPFACAERARARVG